VKLLDFGVAGESTPRQQCRLTQRGMLVGTPSYMTPEHVRDGHVIGDALLQRQSDLWALAVVAYEALTASLPFKGDTLEALLDAISIGPFESPSRRCPGLGVEVDRWFERALHASPDKRFETARDLAQSFASLVPPALEPRTLRPDQGRARSATQSPPYALRSTPALMVRDVKRPSSSASVRRQRFAAVAAVVLALAAGWQLANAEESSAALQPFVHRLATPLAPPVAGSGATTPVEAAPPVDAPEPRRVPRVEPAPKAPAPSAARRRAPRGSAPQVAVALPTSSALPPSETEARRDYGF
jgi:serine/threonine-protein kinase